MDYQFSNDRFYQELRRQSRLASDYGELEGLLVLSHFNADDIFTDRQHSEIYPLDGAAVVIVSRGSIALTKTHSTSSCKARRRYFLSLERKSDHG